MLDTPRLGVSCSQQVGGKGVGWCTVVCSGSLAIGKCAESTACLDCRHSACKWHCVCDQQWSEASSNLRMHLADSSLLSTISKKSMLVQYSTEVLRLTLWGRIMGGTDGCFGPYLDCNSKVLLSVLKRNHSSSCQQ
eukprot:scaffold14685_cov18-Tisochrysis_lutea.AAC.3